jgi:hypothetical protein
MGIGQSPTMGQYLLGSFYSRHPGNGINNPGSNGGTGNNGYGGKVNGFRI